MSRVALASHEHIAPLSTLSSEKIKKCFQQTLALNRMKGRIFIEISSSCL